MKFIVKESSKRAAFTIVELLTVMSIIVILISLLVPSLNMVKRYAKRVKQKAQFHSISVAMDLFNAEQDGYPNSDAQDRAVPPMEYCGAMKLCEAMMGQDLLGFHPASRFRSDGTDGFGTLLYDPGTIDARRGPYLQLENANAYKLRNLYGVGNSGLFNEERFVLCDVYTVVQNTETGKKIGMPILYYKANTSNVLHDPNAVPFSDYNIYNFLDNNELVKLGVPWDSNPAAIHPLADVDGPVIFYESILNEKITTMDRPYRADSYILVSAGFDGMYGTNDDIFNFER